MNYLLFCVLLLTVLTRISFAKRINTFIPQYCTTLRYNSNLNIEELKQTGNDSVLVVTAYLHEGLKLPENTRDTECYLIVRAPVSYGIISTVKKISFHDNDTLSFQSSSNDGNVWVKNDEEHKYKEILALPRINEQSSIRIKYVPSVTRVQHNAGFEIVFSAYRDKQSESCGDDFDCGNDRCIAQGFLCDGFNNCGNEKDESGCAGVSLWIIILLIGIGILVVCLAIFVWYRMAQR